MFLAFKLSDIVTVPFGWLMGWLYQVTNNYGIAMILFAVCVQMALLPLPAHLFGVCPPGGAEIRRMEGRLAGHQAHRTLPAIFQAGLV